MPTYLTPGVYVEEVPSTSKPIEGVGTSIAAFVGLAPGGPVNTPMRISNWTQFAKIYGDPNEPDNGPFMEGAYLAHSVYGFFQNGGGLCWVVRVGAVDGDGARAVAALPAATDKNIEVYKAEALEAANGAPIKVEITEEPNAGGENGGDQTYKVVVDAGSAGKEEYEGLTLKKGRQNIATKVNAASKLIKITEAAGLPDARPAAGTYTLTTPSSSADAVKATDCEGAGDRMAILDAPPNLLQQEILEWRMNTAGYDSKFATLYYPWIEVMDPLSNQPMLVPPSGHVAGVWCRTDATRGVHKAPANEVVMGVNGLGFQVTQGEQGGLNKVGINCIRSFPGRGIRIWGARTLSSDPEWRYINVRRLFNYIAESIMEGTQWSVFEPNDERLWMQLRISASNFLHRTWREGALFGATPEQAFYVKCDAETNPPEVIEAGQVICEIGISPVKPAEFVVFRLSQFSAGAGE